jgi:prepilin-type N-terminal cleavage/methylation domain-containing protein
MKNIENKGFTLIELLATIVILAVVLTVSSYLITTVIKLLIT